MQESRQFNALQVKLMLGGRAYARARKKNIVIKNLSYIKLTLSEAQRLFTKECNRETKRPSND